MILPTGNEFQSSISNNKKIDFFFEKFSKSKKKFYKGKKKNLLKIIWNVQKIDFWKRAFLGGRGGGSASRQLGQTLLDFLEFVKFRGTHYVLKLVYTYKRRIHDT